MNNYRLTYSKTEDRVLVSVDDRPDGIALTRRLTRELLKTMAAAVGQQKAKTTGPSQLHRNTILNFEQSKAVSEAYGKGQARRERRKPPRLGSCKIVTAVDVGVKQAGGAALTFRKNDKKVLTLDFGRDDTYFFISSLCEIAAHAEWDFAEIASWLEPAAVAEAKPPPPSAMH